MIYNSKELTVSTVGANSGIQGSPRRSVVFGRRSPQKPNSPNKLTQQTHISGNFLQTPTEILINKPS